MQDAASTSGSPVCPVFEIKLGMTNFDGSIDDGFDDALRAEPCFGRHASWNFNGRVFFAEGRFHEEVWRYGSLIKTISSDSLPELMRIVNDEFGYD